MKDPERRFNVIQAMLFSGSLGITAAVGALALGGWRWVLAFWIICSIALALLFMLEVD
jgi:hypothetical protein